jgi:hypothetical protein
MKRIVVGMLFAAAMSIGMVGCAEKTQVKETKTTETPTGTKTETKTDEIKKTGDEAAPSTTTPPPANP